MRITKTQTRSQYFCFRKWKKARELEVETTSYVHIKINLSFIDESLLTSLVFILAYWLIHYWMIKKLNEPYYFVLIFLQTYPKLCKGLVWQNFKENTPEGEPSFSALSLALRSSHIFYRFLASTTFVETEICTFYLIWGLMWAIL